MIFTITHQLESLLTGGARLHTRFRIKTPLPDRLARPFATLLLKASPVAKWHPNIARMLKEELGNADSVEALAPTAAA